MSSMRVAMVILLTLAMTLPAGITIAGDGEEKEFDGQSRVEFTHTVFAEEVTATWCQYCPSASENLNSVYESGDYPFYFVALITDVNDKAMDRAQNDYNLYGYPTVYFDGGDEVVVGGQSDETNYRNAIETCGEREVPSLTINLQVSSQGAAVLDVSVTVNNNEIEDYTGHIRVYITEIVSRYNDYDGNPYHFGFLDYAFDEDIVVPASGSWSDSVTWDGAEHEDSNGDDFGDIEPSNIMVLAAVFNSEGHPASSGPGHPFIAYYADQATGAKPDEDNTPPDIEFINPKDGDTVSGVVQIRAEVTDESGIANVAYRIDDGQDVTMIQEGTSDIYYADWDTEMIQGGEHTITITASDMMKNTGSESITVFVNNEDLVPPYVEIKYPKEGDTVKGTITITATATDESGIEKVEFYINDELRNTDTDEPYQWDWDTTMNADGEYTIKVIAYDNSENHNSATDMVNVTVNNTGGGDTAPPAVSITSPEQQVVGGLVTIEVDASDESGIERVEFYIDDELKETDYDEPYQWGWDTTEYEDGEHEIKVIAYDNSENHNPGIATKTVTVDNSGGDVTPPSVSIISPTSDVVKGSVKVKVDASDESGIERVEFYIGKEGESPELKYTDTDEPYEWDWNTTEYDDGKYDISVIAYDNSQYHNYAKDTKTVTVNNAGEDTRPPTVEIISPTETLIRGIVTVKADADDEFGVKEVKFYLDGNFVRRDDSEPYELRWATANYSDGEHTVKAEAFDDAGNSAFDERTYTVDNEPPELGIDKPEDAKLRGNVSVKVTATDASGIEKVEFYIDDALTYTNATPDGDTFTWLWDTSTASDGGHEIKITAYDKAGNSKSEYKNVTTDNTAPTVTNIEWNPESPVIGDEFIINATITDANGIDDVVVEYCSAGVCYEPEKMENLENDLYTSSIDTSELEDYIEFNILAKDTFGNTYSTEKFNVTLGGDVNAPEITGFSYTPKSPKKGDTITITVKVIDQSAISKVTLNYCVGDVCYPPITMNPAGDDEYTATIDTAGIKGKLKITITAKDEFGNSYTTEEYYITVEEKKGKGSTPGFEIVLLLSLVALVLLLSRRR